MVDTVAELILARADDSSTALLFEDMRWSYEEFVAECATRGAFIQSLCGDSVRGFHVGVLLDNVPEFPFWLGAAALVGATVVGINPTRRGSELERDIAHSACSVVVTDSAHRALVDGLTPAALPIFEVDSEDYAKALAPSRGARARDLGPSPTKGDLFLLIFTSGTSSAPKAVICSQGRLAMIGSIVGDMFSITSDDVCYEAMPMFHSNALMACWCPAIAKGAAFAMRRKFSASGFLPDVRRFGATYFNYVGKTLSYVLATPEAPDDSDNPLTRGFGNEATRVDVEAFSRRFGCQVTDGYGSTEGGAAIASSPDTPPGALGPVPPGTVILDPADGQECPRALFDEQGRLLNADTAIGEIVNRFGSLSFEGYWDNEEATAERLRDGSYWTGDLGYVDEQGFIYFAGRTYDWLRVDGENFAAAPVERIISRHPDVTLAAVYAVPDAISGDQVMVALQLREGVAFDGKGFRDFLEAQEDLGTKWSPRYVRLCNEMPVTESNKILKRSLSSQGWTCADPVFWRPKTSEPYRLLTAEAIETIKAEFAVHGRSRLLDRD